MSLVVTAFVGRNGHEHLWRRRKKYYHMGKIIKGKRNKRCDGGLNAFSVGGQGIFTLK